MPATKFICPNGDTVNIQDCLNKCQQSCRCMFLPTLRAIAKSLERNLPLPSVTELLNGTRELYLKKTTDYAVDPRNQLYALHGSGVHAINETQTHGNMLAEERIFNSITSGQLDLYGEILTGDDGTLGDLKVTSSYKLMKALGYYKVDVETGEVYKTGAKKGQPKTRKEFRSDGVRHVLDWAIQLNAYRMLLEENGYTVNQMVIQALCRDASLRIASERGITEPLYLIPINKISDRWIKRYLEAKAKRLSDALETNIVPGECSAHECWNGRKCEGYCPVSEQCKKLSATAQPTTIKVA
ncbi:hypothetical protein [Veillonella sp. 3960]|uniref:hypothetical protein n=1 Tax=Veillonella sp. 3960 TaxID=2490955 RepID=UPI000F8E92DA|nr:hypothetical protein [Veillonella sp. 3960]